MKTKRKVGTSAAPQEGQEADKKARGKLLSLHPLTPEEALRRAMQAGPMPSDPKKD